MLGGREGERESGIRVLDNIAFGFIEPQRAFFFRRLDRSISSVTQIDPQAYPLPE